VGGSGLTLGALGGPHTFNGQAAEAMVERYQEFTKVVHYPTSQETIAAALRGDVDAACAPEQSSVTGFHPGMLARMVIPSSRLYVIAETERVYHCSLLGKPGAELAQVKHVVGHDGSIAHSRVWLEAHLPSTEIEIVSTNSIVAAQAVLSSDGCSIASVGSPGLAAKFGLAELAKDIDMGSMVNYWAVSLQARCDENPTRLIITGRFDGDGQMSELIGALVGAGYSLTTIYPRHTGRALDEYDCLLRLKGAGSLGTIRSALTRFASARLAGAWTARG
jgi:prephenate dehydratase